MTGRPKKTLDDLPENWQAILQEAGESGASKLECRHKLGISQDLWERFVREEPEFSVAVKRAEEACQVWWESLGRNMAMGGIDKGNATTWIFNMKNRFNWRDKQEIDQKTEHSGQIRMSSEQADAVLIEAGIDPQTLKPFE